MHAMMDCSDGIATDLEHICRESGVGARVRLDGVPVAPAARVLPATRSEWTRGSGRWEAARTTSRCSTCEPEAASRLAEGLVAATGTPLTVIGRIEGPAGAVVFVDESGRPVSVRSGYQHFQE